MQLPSQCGSMYSSQGRSVSETHFLCHRGIKQPRNMTNRPHQSVQLAKQICISHETWPTGHISPFNLQNRFTSATTRGQQATSVRSTYKTDLLQPRHEANRPHQSVQLTKQIYFSHDTRPTGHINPFNLQNRLTSATKHGQQATQYQFNHIRNLQFV